MSDDNVSPNITVSAFETMQKQFDVFSGTVTKIGLAKTNPHRDIAVFELKQKLKLKPCI